MQMGARMSCCSAATTRSRTASLLLRTSMLKVAFPGMTLLAPGQTDQAPTVHTRLGGGGGASCSGGKAATHQVCSLASLHVASEAFVVSQSGASHPSTSVLMVQACLTRRQARRD